MERLWQTLSGDGLILTDLRDHKWFHSMYLTEPGGINVEFSNCEPGFEVVRAHVLLQRDAHVCLQRRRRWRWER
jgi:hypothetical protein